MAISFLGSRKINKQLFAKGSFLGARFFFFLLLSLVVMISDYRFHYFHKVKSALSVVVLPVQELVSWPAKSFHWVDSRVKSRHALLDQNNALKQQLLLLQVKTQKIIALENENAQLRALLSSSTHLDGKVLVAQLLAVNVNPLDPQIVLDKGRGRGAYIGQPVFDATGVMGQVVEVGPYTSRVLLATSNRSAIPVQDVRNNVRAIAVGAGYTGDMQLVHVPDTVDIKPGDKLVTSGLGLRFPIGYPVGVVQSVKHIVGERFARIEVMPSAHLNSSRQVLLVWPEQSKLAKQVRAMLAPPHEAHT